MSDQKIKINKQNTNKQTNTKKILNQELKEVKREIIKEKEQEKQEEQLDKKITKSKQSDHVLSTKQSVAKQSNVDNKSQSEQYKENMQAKSEAIAKAKTGLPLRTAIIYILSSKNNTHVTLTDITGSEILAKASGGMLVKNKAHRDEQAAAIGLVQIVETALAAHKISRLIVKVRGIGGIKSDRVGQAAQIILKMLSRDKYKIIQLEDVTPIFYGKKTKYGRRGRKV